jgi:hypothetical protein
VFGQGGLEALTTGAPAGNALDGISGTGVIIGGVLVAALRSSVPGLALPVLLKVGMDIKAHEKERAKLAGAR